MKKLKLLLFSLAIFHLTQAQENGLKNKYFVVGVDVNTFQGKFSEEIDNNKYFSAQYGSPLTPGRRLLLFSA